MSFFQPTAKSAASTSWPPESPVEVEPELFKLLCLAKEIWRETEGALTSRPPVVASLGICPPPGLRPSDEQIAEALSQVGFQFVELDGQRNTIHFSRPGMQLNLGSIGKGYALDRCAANSSRAAWSIFCCTAGKAVSWPTAEMGDCPNFRGHRRAAMVGENGTVPFGSSSKSHEICHSNQEPCEKPDQVVSDFWTIGIPHPWKPNKRDSGIPPSKFGDWNLQFTVSIFPAQRKKYGHIIDPRKVDRPTVSFRQRLSKTAVSIPDEDDGNRASGPAFEEVAERSV